MDNYVGIKKNILEYAKGDCRNRFICKRRFLDQWAEDNILKELKNCFAHYEKDDIMRSLRATHDLFDRIAGGVAEMLGYDYPAKAKECAEKFINRCN